MEEHVEITDLYLDPDHMKMMDTDGYIIYDIFRIIPPAVFFLFLEKKENMEYWISGLKVINLFYPSEDDW